MRRWQLITAVGLTMACGDDDSDATTSVGSGGPGTTTSTTSATSAGSDGGSGTTGGGQTGPWEPGRVLRSIEEPNARGFLDRRGLIHTHSPYSHDACDGEPRDADGNIDAQCMEDLRRGLCQTQHDFVFLTDHRESFSDTEFPETMLYDPGRGDTLVSHDSGPVASWAGCEDGTATLIMAGVESATMPVGLEGHVPGRGEVYGEATPEALQTYKDHGAITLVSHTEDWTPEELIDLPLDGFEMFNVHATFLGNLLGAAALIDLVRNDDPGLPHSDMVLFPLIFEDDRYLETWGTVLARGARKVTTMGTDAHRNTLPNTLPDGERVDSFRRMTLWFSNHLLVQPKADGTWDDIEVKAALRAGRLYGVFEYLGYAENFDYYARAGDVTREMGDEISRAAGAELVVGMPRVRELDDAVVPPELSAHLYLAIEGGWQEVASATEDFTFTPTASGAYRVEVRIAPRHVEGFLGDFAADAADDRPWIYSNPIYVVD